MYVEKKGKLHLWDGSRMKHLPWCCASVGRIHYTKFKVATETNIDHMYGTESICTLHLQVIRCAGHFQRIENTRLNLQLSAAGAPPIKVMAIVCSPVPHPSNIETPLDSKTFLSRHNMSMKFTYVDDR